MGNLTLICWAASQVFAENNEGKAELNEYTAVQFTQEEYSPEKHALSLAPVQILMRDGSLAIHGQEGDASKSHSSAGKHSSSMAKSPILRGMG